MNPTEALYEKTEANQQQNSPELRFDTQPTITQEADQGLKKLANVARTQPEQMYKSIIQLEELIADTSDDPKTQGRAFLNLARCFLGVSANKSSHDPEGARIVLHGTPTGRLTPDHYGKPRGYDGAIDALREASKRLPRDNNIRLAEEMTMTLARKLQR